jgi:hypothetical protein
MMAWLLGVTALLMRGRVAGRFLARTGGAVVAASAVIALFPGSALADLWVSSSGADSDYCSQANPCATISRALSLAIPTSSPASMVITVRGDSGIQRRHISLTCTG